MGLTWDLYSNPVTMSIKVRQRQQPQRWALVVGSQQTVAVLSKRLQALFWLIVIMNCGGVGKRLFEEDKCGKFHKGDDWKRRPLEIKTKSLWVSQWTCHSTCRCFYYNLSSRSQFKMKRRWIMTCPRMRPRVCPFKKCARLANADDRLARAD